MTFSVMATVLNNTITHFPSTPVCCFTNGALLSLPCRLEVRPVCAFGETTREHVRTPAEPLGARTFPPGGRSKRLHRFRIGLFSPNERRGEQKACLMGWGVAWTAKKATTLAGKPLALKKKKDPNNYA